MKNVIQFEKIGEISKVILDVFYNNGFHKELAKDKEKYGCKRNISFTEHAIKTLNYAVAITDLYYQENPQRNTDDNIKKIVTAALFHDINKTSKYKKEKETDFELEDIEYILSDLGLYSEFKDCAKFILASSIHKGRQQNTYKIAYALDENEEEMEIIRCADALASMNEINNVVKKLKEVFLVLGLDYKINYLKIKEIRPAITNIMLKALEQHICDTNRKMFCYFENYVIYLGEIIDFEKEIDEIVNKTLLIPTMEYKCMDAYIDCIAGKVRDKIKYVFDFFDMFLLLDTQNQLEILRKSLTSKSDDVLFRALKNRFNKINDKIDKSFKSDIKFQQIDNILKRKEDELFIKLLRQIFIYINSYHTFLSKENVKDKDIYEEVFKLFNEIILNISELDENYRENINFMRSFQKILDDGGSRIYYILLSSYIANLILQTDDYKDIINKMEENFKISFEKNIQKIRKNSTDINLLKQELKDYFYEVFGNKINDTDYIFKDNKIKSTCLICGRKIPEGLGFQKSFLDTKYSFKLKPKELVVNNKGKLTKDISPTQQPYLCKICAYDALLQKTFLNQKDTSVNPDIYVYTYKDVDFPITIDVFKKAKREIMDKIDERTLYNKKFNDKSIFIKAQEKELEVEINKTKLSKEFYKHEYRFDVFAVESSDTEKVLKTYYQALLLSYYYSLNTTVTSAKILNINNIDVLFDGEYENIYFKKIVKNLTNIEDYKALEEPFYLLNSVFLIEDMYNGFKGQRSRELIPLITKMSVHPLGIFNYLRFKDSSERAAFFKVIYENKLNGSFINSLFKIANLNGGAQMTVCSEIAEKMLKFWKPNKIDSSYIITLPFRRSVKTIKEVKTNNIQEIKEIVCGSVRDLVERHNTVYSPTYGVDRINAIEQFVDVFIYGYYEGVCKCKKGELSKNENYFASAIEFLVLKNLYDDNKKREEVKNE
ncbi:MAG: hypothetical protein N2505_06140 [Endomicrobia bacterium]|nr:hypothetical protein [Endomicrobiia bacterium]